MNYVTLFLALRYLRGTAYDNTISWMVRICFLAIMIGSFALTLVHAVMYGYEQEIHKKMQGVHAQIIIRSNEHALNADAITDHIHAYFPDIVAVSPSMTDYGLVRPTDQDTTPTVVMLKGINPALERLTSCIEEKIISSNPHLTCIQGNTVLIGNALAKHCMVGAGDSLELLYFKDHGSRSAHITMDSTPLIVGGIFKTGIDEFDTSVIFCSHQLMRQLCADQEISTIHIKLAPHADEQKVIHDLQQALHLQIYSWKELYPALVSALKLEKYAMFLILLLITLVASLNMISLLFMYITQKRADIALLYTLGATHTMVMSIFMCIGMCIASIACTVGIMLAWIICHILNTYPFIELPDAYYVTHLPAIMDWPLVIVVFCAVMALSFIATATIAYKTRNIRIARVLKFEG